MLTSTHVIVAEGMLDRLANVPSELAILEVLKNAGRLTRVIHFLNINSTTFMVSGDPNGLRPIKIVETNIDSCAFFPFVFSKIPCF